MNTPETYEDLLSDNTKKTYREIRKELDGKHKFIQESHEKSILSRKNTLMKKIEEVVELKKVYTYGERKKVRKFIFK
jgi:hypothetical protein